MLLPFDLIYRQLLVFSQILRLLQDFVLNIVAFRPKFSSVEVFHKNILSLSRFLSFHQTYPQFFLLSLSYLWKLSYFIQFFLIFIFLSNFLSNYRHAPSGWHFLRSFPVCHCRIWCSVLTVHSGPWHFALAVLSDSSTPGQFCVLNPALYALRFFYICMFCNNQISYSLLSNTYAASYIPVTSRTSCSFLLSFPASMANVGPSTLCAHGMYFSSPKAAELST